MTSDRAATPSCPPSSMQPSPVTMPAPGGWWRVWAALAGLGFFGFGVVQLLTGGRSTDVPSAVVWLAGVLLGHDVVLAPLALAAGWVLARVTRGRRGVARAVAGGLLTGTCLVLLALPPLLTPGVAGNPSATPRDYVTGIAVAVAAAVAVTATAAGMVAWRAARRRRGGDPDRSGDAG
jgi:hypothetical protein